MVQTSLKMKMMETFRFRMLFFLGIVSVMLAFLIIQLANIQLIHGNEFSVQARMNMENNIPIPAPRGEIYDRNFKFGGDNVIVVSNRPSFSVTTISERYKREKDLYRSIKGLSRLLNVSYEDVINKINSKSSWERVVIKEDVGFDVIVKIASHQNKFSNIDWENESVRVYNWGDIFFHIIGYVGTISKDEYKNLKKRGYRYYQKIGKAGLEKEYDIILRGVDGFMRRIVDVRNRVEGEEIGDHPVVGNNLVLTVDTEVQKCAYEAMTSLKGAVVVLKPASGEILALVSKPDIDPNLIISRDNFKIMRELNNNIDRPFLNRAIQSRYPPASTFKLLTSISALEEENWEPKWSFNCSGKYTLKGYINKDFYCYKRHGLLDMRWAIAKSCSAYFYQLGYKIGPTIILKYANLMGLPERTDIDIPGEISSFIPSKEWKVKIFGQSWYDGDTLNLSIGQGFVSITPISMANFICRIVNNGIAYRPHLVKEIRSKDNAKVIKRIVPEKLREIPLSPFTIDTIKKGMRLAVKKGTAIRLNSLKVQVAGKTGTAQTRSKREEDRSQHAWFVGYAPYDGEVEESVVLVVLVEYGISGAVSAVPVAEKIFSKLISLGYL